MKKLISVGVIFSILFFSCNNSEDILYPHLPAKSDLTRTGKFIAFSSKHESTHYNVFLAQVDSNGFLATSNLVFPANPFNLTAGMTSFDDKSQPAWSSNGRILALSVSYGYLKEIFAYFFDINGQFDSSVSPNPKKLINSNGNQDANPCFSPNMQYIVFERKRVLDENGKINLSYSREIYCGHILVFSGVIFIDTIFLVTDKIPGDKSNPKWSPRILINKVSYDLSSSDSAEDRRIYNIDPLSPTNNLVYQNSGISGYASWNPVCNEILFEYKNNSSGNYKIVKAGYPANLGIADIISSNQYEFRYPVRKPNSNLIAYVKKLPFYLVGDIWIYSLETGNNFKLLPDNWNGTDNTLPAW
jgi:hypothetical protein